VPNATDELRASMRELLQELKENRKAVDGQLQVLQQKIELMPDRLEVLRKEVYTGLLSRIEFDTKHSAMLDRLNKHDLVLDTYSKYIQDCTVVQSETKAELRTLGGAIKQIKEDKEGSTGRVMQYIAIILAILSFIINLFQHIKFS
jgi:DNA repair ATPase RecN